MARFEKLSVALDEGYRVDYSNDYYVPGKGIELTNPAITALDSLKPQSLIYEIDRPLCDSSDAVQCPETGYKLVAMKYAVPDNGGGIPPSLDGQAFEGPVGTPPVYELYNWVKDNPNGVHAKTNPTVMPPDWWPHIYSVFKGLNEKYPTPDEALAGGYNMIVFQLPNGQYTDCVPWPAGKGGMGYHYVKLAEIKYDPASIDPDNPQGLVYEKREDGTWMLAAEEWFLWTSPGGPRPTINGFGFDGPMPAHGPGQAEHYDLHAYVGLPNPEGLYTKWNSRVGCPFTNGI